MNDLNSVYIVGRLVKDAKMSKGVTTFTLANNCYTYDEEKIEHLQETNFFKCQLNCKNKIKLVKGTRVGVNGRMKTTKNGIIIKTHTVQVMQQPPKGFDNNPTGAGE